MATYDVFTDVMEHAEKFSHVTTPEGAFAFNQMFEEPVSHVSSYLALQSLQNKPLV